ncbi:hypothetical protein TSAR_007325 [Trichomalopsis sarcophagae]|uniref:Uncharacterized protein n=1 Tax=Trichomalopsis sarcophagae TaxID=543379 RepID=A0A232FIL6_9HYME|nr:hypothetical protein TSAR_007325 [Trichomalopsis sarcophagae]
MYQPQQQNNELREVLNKFSEQEKELEKRIQEWYDMSIEPTKFSNNSNSNNIYFVFLLNKKNLDRTFFSEELHRELVSKSTKNKSTSPLSNLRYQREVSHIRNQQLLKDLEKSKAILRTESTFTPNEQELRDLAAAYRELLQK